MRKIWSFSSVDGLTVGLTLAATLLVLPASAATILRKEMTITLDGAGGAVERMRLEVRLDEEKDLEDWSHYPIYLDTHRDLRDVMAYAALPGGKRHDVKRRDRDTMEFSGGYVLAGSAYFEVLRFDTLVVGARLVIVHTVDVKPYFPAGSLVLLGDEPIERLKVRVSGGGEHWRYRLDGADEGLMIAETLGGVEVTGTDLGALDPPDSAPKGIARGPVLRYGWGRPGTWEEVGAWYEEILAAVPRAAEPVRREARQLVAGIEDPRARLEALLAFLRKKVRYVAVEMGIGGYRPSTPEEVLERRWGDCKDKSLLLIDLLAEAGIPAHPVLILADEESRVDVAFPSPDQFNHLIVAIPEGAVPVADGDPVSQGYLFLDPTQTRGSGGWLHPGVQDQDVLVVGEGTAELVRTPIRHHEERRELVVNLQISPQGSAVGGVGLALYGWPAALFLEQIGSTPPERTEELARAIFSRQLPGVDLGQVGWNAEDQNTEGGGVPEVQLSASFRLDGFTRGVERPSFRLTGLTALSGLPPLDEREAPLVLSPRVVRSTWHVSMPEGWCRPAEAEQEVENELGSFVQTLRHPESANRFTLERRSMVVRRFADISDFANLIELAVAESRAQRRRVRLECGEASGG